jgi:hypothetical protein
MTEPPARAGLKFQLAAFAERYVLPSRPSSAPQAALDAHRQTSFLLGDGLALFERAMNLQLQIVAANARARTPAAAALFTLWSRAFANLADACSALTVASYASCPPLLRTALDSIAVQRALEAEGFSEYEAWFAAAVSQVKEKNALAIEPGPYRAASVLIQNEHLGTLYRLLTALTMPHFGASALLAAPDIGLQKMSAGFADSAFHLGWAEATLGWLLQLAAAQIETVLATQAVQTPDALRSEGEAAVRDSHRAAADPRRCHAEIDGDRFLFHNFRRTATGQPRRIIL